MINSSFKILVRCFKQSIFEEKCLGCRDLLLPSSPRTLCRECECLISQIYQELICKKCGALIKDGDSNICGNCTLTKNQKIKTHVSYGLYEGLLRELILKYKYKDRHSLVNYFAKMIFDVYKTFFDNKIDIVIPVPFDRKRPRTYEPTFLLVKKFGKMAGLSYKRNILYKKKSTPTQAGLSYKKRCSNLKGAFAVKNIKLLKGKRLLIIDDVYTTGTTLKECADVLSPFCLSISAITLAKVEI